MTSMNRRMLLAAAGGAVAMPYVKPAAAQTALTIQIGPAIRSRTSGSR